MTSLRPPPKLQRFARPSHHVFLRKSRASALNAYPRALNLNISAKVIVPDIITTNGAVVTGKLKTVSVNNKSLIAWLNASPTVQSYITNNITHSAISNSITAGSYFVWDMLTEAVWVTNKNGFTFDVDNPVSFYIDYDEDTVVGSAKLADVTGAGSEMDVTGVKFYFDDNNGNILEPEYGEGVFNWTYGAVSGGVQQKTISIKLSPAAYYAEVNGVSGITTTFNASGSGSSAGLAPFGSLDEPYWYWATH